MTRTLTFFAFALVATGTLLAAGPDTARLATPTGLPCVLAMVDQHLFASGASVAVRAASTGVANCPGSVIIDPDGRPNNALWMTLQRWNLDAEWQTFMVEQFLLAVGQTIRNQVASFTLADGRYRLLLISGAEPGPWHFLDAVHFTVGGTREDTLRVNLGFAPRFDPEGRTPSVKSARTAYDGRLYFGGNLSAGYATGFVYQVAADGRTEFLPVEFRQAGNNRIFSELPGNSFDGTRPVYASVTADGGGITVQGIAFDPTDPDANFGGFNR